MTKSTGTPSLSPTCSRARARSSRCLRALSRMTSGPRSAARQSTPPPSGCRRHPASRCSSACPTPRARSRWSPSHPSARRTSKTRTSTSSMSSRRSSCGSARRPMRPRRRPRRTRRPRTSRRSRGWTPIRRSSRSSRAPSPRCSRPTSLAGTRPRRRSSWTRMRRSSQHSGRPTASLSPNPSRRRRPLHLCPPPLSRTATHSTTMSSRNPQSSCRRVSTSPSARSTYQTPSLRRCSARRATSSTQ
mmetsp:Transcript_14148/g.36648  ORF Transcript_14148/g.36648 Transcript_14148/m.36648 type:complete len:245 (-) Transcript_14148:525-1259(-)